MDEFLSEESLDFEIQTDILTLLENVKCQGSNPSGLRQALLALATICSSGDVSQEYFFLAGGVDELKSLLLEGSCSLTVVPAALYCLGCAVRQNVTSQNAVLTESMLAMIHELLSHADSSDKLLQASAFLLACIVAGSSKGQLMANETGCLQDLDQLLRDCMTSGCDDENKWSVVTRAVGVCVNNPHNAHNQQACCSVLPHTLKFIRTEPRHICVSHAFTLIGMVVTNNVSNQDRIRRCGGIETLVQFIIKQVNVECVALSLLASAMSAVNACIADNEESAVQAGNLGLIPVLLELLQERNLELSQTQIFILTLAHVLESSSDFCRLVTEGRGYHLLINVLTDSQDEELCKVVKYILTLCKNNENVTQTNGVLDEEHPDSLNETTRDLNSFVKTLSGQLNTMEKISENIQWMKAVDTTHLFQSNPEFECETPAEIYNNDKRGHQVNMYGEVPLRVGNQDGLKQNRRLDYVPQSMNPHSCCPDNRVFNVNDVQPASVRPSSYYAQSPDPLGNIYSKDGMLMQDQHLVIQGTSTGGYAHGGARYVSSRLDTNNPHRNEAGTRNLHSLGEQGFAASPSHESSTQVRIPGNGAAWSHVHTTSVPSYTARDFTDAGVKQGLGKLVVPSYTARDFTDAGVKQGLGKLVVPSYTARDFTDAGVKQGLEKLVPSVSSDFSGCRFQPVRRNISSQLGNAEDGSSLLCNDRGASRSKVTPNVDFLKQQKNCQGHSCKESERIEYFKFVKDGANMKYLSEDSKVPSQRKESCVRAQHQHKEAQAKSLVSCRHHCGTVCEQHEELIEDVCISPAQRQRMTSSVEGDDYGYVQRNGDHHSLCDESLCSAPHVYADDQPTLKSPSSRLNMQVIAQAHTASPPCTSSVKSFSKQMEEELKLNGPLHESRFYQLAELQKMMSSFFKSYILRLPGSLPAHLEVNSREESTQVTDPGSLTRPAVEKSYEQDLLSGDMLLHSLAVPEDILSVCEENDLDEGNILQKILQPECRSPTLDTKQCVEDEASGNDKKLLESLIKSKSFGEEEQENDSCVQKHASIQEASATFKSASVEEQASEKAISSLHEYTAFVKPIQLPPCRPRANITIRSTPNTRLASTSLADHTSAQAPASPGTHQVPPSPALSQFDTHLRRMAYLSTTGGSTWTSRRESIARKLDKSASENGPKPTSRARESGTPSWSRPKAKADQAVHDTPRSNQLPSPCAPISKYPIEVECAPLPLYRKNVDCPSKTQSLLGLDKCLQSNNLAKTVGSPYKPAKSIKRKYHGYTNAVLSDWNSVSSKTSLCPGCTAGLSLNSYTYNMAVETSVHTCAYHRTIRQLEREYIRQKLNSRPSMKRCAGDDEKCGSTNSRDVYDYQSDSVEGRRPRVLYTQQELLNLLDGVTKMGKRWQQILCTYQFHHSRTAVDLKDKYKQLKVKRKQEKQVETERLFSMCEVRRLKNGVKHLGYNWKAILKAYKFLPGRTAEDLHNEWRSLNQL